MESARINPAWVTSEVAEPQFILRSVATAGAVLIGCLFLTYWPTYNYLVLGGRSPLFYYTLPGLIALPLMLLQPVAALRLLKEPVLLWFVCYVVLGMAWLLLAQDFPTHAGQAWRMRVLACFFFITLLLIFVLCKPEVVAFAIAGCIALAGLLNWYDVLFPSTIVPLGFPGANPGRGAGMFINANGAAAFVLMATIALLPFVAMRWRAGILLFAVLAVAPTFSRFGWIFAVLLLPMAIATKLLNRRQAFIIFFAVPVLLVAAGSCYELMQRSGNENLLGRLAWFQSFGEHHDFSMRERAFVAQQAWERFIDSPLYGHGIGATVAKGARVGTHNMYVLLMAEQGLVGLALYLSYIGLLAYRGWRLTRSPFDVHARDIGAALMLYAAFVCAYGFVNHNVLDEPHGMFIVAFLVAISFRAMWREDHAINRDRTME